MKTFICDHANCAQRVIRANTEEDAKAAYVSQFQLSATQSKRVSIFERVVSDELLAAFEETNAVTTVED
mgnify:CR=1 FL=1